jgi:recombinational DNA repair protein RecR
MEATYMGTATTSGNKFPSARRLCEICGKPSASPICASCSDKIRAEAVARKRREDKGLE